jgi:hypothetical protein
MAEKLSGSWIELVESANAKKGVRVKIEARIDVFFIEFALIGGRGGRYVVVRTYIPETTLPRRSEGTF